MTTLPFATRDLEHAVALDFVRLLDTTKAQIQLARLRPDPNGVRVTFRCAALVVPRRKLRSPFWPEMQSFFHGGDLSFDGAQLFGERCDIHCIAGALGCDQLGLGQRRPNDVNRQRWQVSCFRGCHVASPNFTAEYIGYKITLLSARSSSPLALRIIWTQV